MEEEINKKMNDSFGILFVVFVHLSRDTETHKHYSFMKS